MEDAHCAEGPRAVVAQEERPRLELQGPVSRLSNSALKNFEVVGEARSLPLRDVGDTAIVAKVPITVAGRADGESLVCSAFASRTGGNAVPATPLVCLLTTPGNTGCGDALVAI